MKNLINYLKTLWGAWGNLQSKDVRHDCRLTRGVLCFLGKLARRIYSFGCSQDILGAPQSLHSSPSGMTAKLQVNSFMRFAVVLTLIFTIGVGNAWGEDQLVYTLTPANGSNNGYAGNCDVEIDDITWNLTGNSQMQPWRIGGKSITNTDRTVYSKTAMSSAITKVELTVGAASSITVNSLKLIVASDASFNTEIDEVSVTFAANSTLTFKPTSPKTEWATDAYYKFVFNVTVSVNSNKFVEFTEAKFYAEEGGGCTSPSTALSITNANTVAMGNTLSLTTTGGNGGSVTWSVTNGTGSATVSGSTLTPTGVGTVTVTATQGENGGECGAAPTQEITISAAPINVTLHYKGTSTTLNNQTNPFDLTALTTPYTDNACSEWVFDGWYGSTYTKNTSKPTYITSLSSTGHAYAVYKHTEGGSGEGSTETFNLIEIASTNSWSNGVAYTSVTQGNVTIEAQGGGNNGKWYDSGGGSWRMYSGGTVSISSSSGDVTAVTSTPSCTFTIEDGVATFSPSARTDFTEIVVTIGGGGGTTYYTTEAECGPKITATDGLWVTSTKDKRVKIEIPVEATNFASSTNLSYSISGDGFSVVGWGTNGRTVSSSLSTSVIVQYQPTAAYNTTNDATLTISGTGASDAVVTIHGRSLPQKFVIASQINNTKKWKAVPANMTTAGEADGISVETDDNTNPTVVTENYTTAFYGLTEVATYATYGTAVRFSATSGGNMLWGATSGTNINDVTGADERNQEWILNTTDGVEYTLTNAKSSTTLKYFNSTNKFGMLDSGKEKLRFIAAGCDTPPTVGTVTNITSNSATISGWTPAGTVTIKVYSDAACTRDEVVYENVASSLNLTGLFGGYTYYYKIYAGVGCVSAVGSFTTEEGDDHMTVTEWQENAVVISFNGEDADLVLSTYKEEDTGEVEENVADALFFSKYFEADGNNKMLAIYNGTKEKKDLSNYKLVRSEKTGYGDNWGSAEIELSGFGRNETGWIYPNEEIVLLRYTETKVADATADTCARKEDGYDDWYKFESGDQDGSGHSLYNFLAFAGPNSIGLYDKTAAKYIDVIGATTKSDGTGELVQINSSKNSPCNAAINNTYNDGAGFHASNGDNLKTDVEETDYFLSTNRCLLIRKHTVHSGDSAVKYNVYSSRIACNSDISSAFTTLSSEWVGYRIGTEKGDSATCEGLAECGGFDYSDYYEQYTTLVKDQTFEDYRTEPFDGTYTIPVPGLINMACSNVRIDLADSNDPENVLIRKDIQVPIMITKNNQMTTDEIFSSNEKTPEICSTCDLVILNGAVLTKAADNAANDVPAVRNLKVYEGGKLVVPSGTNYTVNTLALRRENDAISMADIKGSLTVSQENGVSMDLRTDPQEWHYIALPFDCNKADITFADGTPAVQGTDYLLRWYNGAYRAANKTGGWENYTGATLLKGHGYIIGLKGSGIIKKELHFPMANGVIAAEKADKEIGSLYAYGGGKTDAELTPNHKGWNLIGNPYMMEYGHWADNAEGAVLPTGMLVENEGIYERNGNGVRYIVEPVANGRSGYTQTAIGSHNMKPFTAYFIQVGGASPSTPQSVTFQTSKRASIVRRREAEDPETDNLRPIWYGIEITAANAEKDNTTLLISDNFTDDYDMMDDLVKMRGSKYNDLSVTTAPVLASRNNAGEMAFNALPDNTAAVTGVPLNYYAAQAGTYTIATDSRYNLTNIKEAWLFDSTTGQYNDLLQGNYSFTTDAGDNSTRFRLFVTVDRAKAPEVATGCDNLLDGQLSLVTIDKTLVLSGLTEDADIYVYDMSGKLINGSHTQGGIWRATVPSQGVYFVRVNGISGQQTLRTIVK